MTALSGISPESVALLGWALIHFVWQGAAVAAVLTSLVAESSLTGLGGGGFMLVHDPERSVLIDFFVEAPGRTVRMVTVGRSTAGKRSTPRRK